MFFWPSQLDSPFKSIVGLILQICTYNIINSTSFVYPLKILRQWCYSGKLEMSSNTNIDSMQMSFFPSKIVWGKVSAFFFFTPSSPMGKPRIIVLCYQCCGTVNNSIKIFHGTSFCFQNIKKHVSKVNSTKVVLLNKKLSLHQPLNKKIKC